MLSHCSGHFPLACSSQEPDFQKLPNFNHVPQQSFEWKMRSSTRDNVTEKWQNWKTLPWNSGDSMDDVTRPTESLLIQLMVNNEIGPQHMTQDVHVHPYGLHRGKCALSCSMTQPRRLLVLWASQAAPSHFHRTQWHYIGGLLPQVTSEQLLWDLQLLQRSASEVDASGQHIH